jgi:hypothetical protein
VSFSCAPFQLLSAGALCNTAADISDLDVVPEVSSVVPGALLMLRQLPAPAAVDETAATASAQTVVDVPRMLAVPLVPAEDASGSP